MEGSASTSQGLASLTSMSTAYETNETIQTSKKETSLNTKQIVDTAPLEANYYAGSQIAPQCTISRILSADCCGDFQNTNEDLGH